MSEFYYHEPYIMVFLLVIIISILFCIRYLLINSNSDKVPRVLIGNAQTIGKREEQEDSFSTLVTENGVLAVVADGMGGYTGGKLASNITVNTFLQEFKIAEDISNIDEFFRNAANLSNRAVLDKSKGKRMGTTLVSVIVSDGQLYWASVGDSAIVLFKDGEFINLNKKHIFEAVLEEQYVSGRISEEQLLNNPMKKRITSYIGSEVVRDVEIGKKPIKLRPGDRVILCSDGVYNSVSELEMEKIFMKKTDPFKASEEIIDLIKSKNFEKQDNATVIILEYSC